MFRIDSDAVIDATMAGGPARYINHSCSVSVRLCPALFNRSDEGDGNDDVTPKQKFRLFVT